eukprot:CAMPEP_0201544512 /NCGR_PEP_ID=MMETSP0173_2-20130828/1152_1 /ASSEMBLY_ACC=CAM_ASM_000268 /TAXON_ID=218659 /ORGANISM="Vexillifera sp., Strain DIVA3 564/2" /LENGTH=65 /DNA_ID=CAMNT_0047952659 /DNA_START=160 /DNA_END=357 /DNA_ORIENTATION=-
MAHPLEHKIILTIRTNDNSSPRTALRNAFDALKSQYATLEEQFLKRVQEKRGGSTTSTTSGAYDW